MPKLTPEALKALRLVYCQLRAEARVPHTYFDQRVMEVRACILHREVDAFGYVEIARTIAERIASERSIGAKLPDPVAPRPMGR